MDSKYFSIYNDFVGRIETGYLEANSKLPSESELMEGYGVSRDTVRKALNLLEQKGYIQKLQGKGSFVLDINRYDFPVSGLISFKELAQKMNMKAKTTVKKLELFEPDSFLKNDMDLAEEGKVWEVIRIRQIGDQKIILDKDYLSEKFVPNLTVDICENSIYEHLEKSLGLKIGYAKKEITVQACTEEDKAYLDLKGYDMIVVVRSHVYLEDTSLFQYTESRHRPDKFKFVDFARRSL
ncbi:trehalose operon repressor [Clostridium swellfunianum]|uniref:trehalose operon repressor n=1 Tax=Clostridium swellfunianum TaxID=1367462 RepID=UPI0020301C13|nr:trehalose operon repressor [Clostridium swellfunianum]MCM0647624.1 trehalose operon repressor [Clostridium swellfunianum]